MLLGLGVKSVSRWGQLEDTIDPVDMVCTSFGSF